MRDRDPSINFDDLPDIQAEKRDNLRAERPAPARKPQKTPPPATSNHSSTIFFILVCIIAALGFLGFQLYAQSTKLDARVVELENRLSSTDESLSQSGVAMQVAFKELQARVTAQKAEIDKFWSSAWKKNQTEIESHGKKLESLAQALKAQSEQVAALQKMDESYAADIKVINARTETLSAMDASIKEQAQTLASLKKQNADMQKASTQMLQKVEQNAGWIESNNAFRQQTNQSLTRLEQQLKNLQSTSSTIITP